MRGYRFSGFIVDLAAREVRRNGYRVPLQPQPFQILCRLLEAAGHTVTRDQLIRLLWGDTHLANPDQSLNIAVRKLREGLDDASDEPKFIQTFARQGYRFIGEFEKIEPEPAAVPDPEPETRLAPVPVRPRPRWLWPAVAVMLAASIGAGWLLWREAQGWNLRQRDLVLVAKFADSTGESNLEGAFEALLEVELANSGQVTPVSLERVGDTLRLMRKPPQMRPEIQDANEVCKRDPGIRAVIGGELRRAGAKYMLSVRLLDAATGAVLSGASGEAEERARLADVLRRLSESMREKIGGDPPARQVLDRVTTESLQALKQYSDGHVLGRQGNWAAAELLFREAIRLDPEFATAHLFVAWAIRNQRPAAAEEYVPFGERALALAESATEEEALFIRASYYSLKSEDAQAIPVYEVLLKRFPNHPWGAYNLAIAYRLTGQWAKGDEISLILPELRPNDARAHSRAIYVHLCAPHEDMDRVNAYAEKAAVLAEASGPESYARTAAAERVYTQALVHWHNAEIPEAKAALDLAARKELQARPLSERDLLPLRIAMGYLTLGQVRRSAALFSSIEANLNPRYQVSWGPWPAIFSDDRAAMGKLSAERANRYPHPLAMFALLRTGKLERAAQLLVRMRAMTLGPGGLDSVGVAITAAEAELASSRGDHDAALRLLEPAFPALIERGIAEELLGAQTLARAYEAKGQTAKAVEVLEKATAMPRVCRGFWRALFWPHARFDLIGLYRKLGRHKEAEAVRQEMERLMMFADEEFVLKRQLKAMAAPTT
jgi:DNA-binding winged helix-turn-helix (wHTH) protein/tetratricopeptide (TPR) repeat protein